jgi:hypothetical protein
LFTAPGALLAKEIDDNERESPQERERHIATLENRDDACGRRLRRASLIGILFGSREGFSLAWNPVTHSHLKRDDFSSNRHPALAYWWSMIFSENRYPLFGIML